MKSLQLLCLRPTSAETLAIQAALAILKEYNSKKQNRTNQNKDPVYLGTPQGRVKPEYLAAHKEGSTAFRLEDHRPQELARKPAHGADNRTHIV